MTEATRNPFRQPDASTFAGESAWSANGAALRWTPGPDERRLPSCEDEPVPQNTQQLVAITDCFDSLRRHWRGRRDVFVGSDQFVHWDPAYNSRTNPTNWPPAPDVYVAFGVANRHRSSYVVWEEGKPPDFVLEVLSPSNRRREMEQKRHRYAKMGVPEFFLFDPECKREPALSGFELRDGEYVPLPMQAFAEGAVGVRSKALGLCLCVKPPGPEPLDGNLHWYDPAAGEFLPTSYELADGNHRLGEDNHRLKEDNHRLGEDNHRLKEANQRLVEERRRAEARLAELEALIEKKRPR